MEIKKVILTEEELLREAEEERNAIDGLKREQFFKELKVDNKN